MPFRIAQRLKSAFIGMALGVIIPSLAFGQATLMPNAKQQYLDDLGNPIAGGSVTYYGPGTTIKKTIWQDAAETTPQTNPVTLDTAGRPQPAGQTFGSGCYQQVVQDQNNIQIWSAVTCSTGSGGSGTSTAFSEGVMVGTILPWANLTVPAKYLYTAGQAVNRTTYSQLFTALTYNTTILCQQNIANITVPASISDLVPVGAPIEASCFAPGTKVLSKASGLLTMTNPAIITTSVPATLFPWGDGDGSTTFNIPDLRGRVIAGRDNMNSSTAGVLTSSFYLSTNSQVASATVGTGGTGGVTGTAVYSVGGGTGVAATLNVTISGGAITAINSVATAGVYTVFPTSPAALTYVSGTGSGVTGATANLVSSFIGVNPDAINAAAGSQSHIQTVAELAQHSHTYTEPNGGQGHQHSVSAMQVTAGSLVSGGTGTPINTSTTNTGFSTTGITINNTGGSSPFPTIQPTLTADYIIKALPDDLPSGPGVTSIGGMTGAISCGSGITCNAQTVSIGTLPVANGGTGANTASGARAAAGLNIDELTPTGDANYGIQTTDRGVYHTALTAPRTDTMPLANSVNSGQQFLLSDVRGVVTGTNTVSITRSGSDLINGVTTFTALSSTNAMTICVADGVSRWNCQPFAGVVGGLLSSNNTWTGDNIFTNGRPWCDVRSQGALGDFSHDDGPAFQACVNLLVSSYGGGVVYVPPSPNPYCIKTGVSVNTGNPSTGGITFQGSGPIEGVALATCGNNTSPILNLNNQWVTVRSMTLYGYGRFENPFVSGLPTQPAILINTGCTQCTLQNVYVTGGTTALQIESSGYVIDNVWASFSYGDGTHAKGLVYTNNGGGSIRDSHFDMAMPVNGVYPAHGTSISAWSSAHAYTTNTVVIITCSGRTWWIQAANNGTSGASSPACAAYGNYIQDNVTGSCPSPSAGVCWLLVNNTDSYCLQIDSASIEVNIAQTDMTCAANYNLGITNTFGVTAPQQIHINPGNTPGGGFSGNVLIHTGSRITMMGLETSFCLFVGCAGVGIDNASAQIIDIIGLDCLNSFAYCVNITAATTAISVSNMRSSGADTADFNVSAAATAFKLVSSTHVSGAANLYTIGAVAAAHYLINDNICNGASASDGGTGGSKVVTTTCAAGQP